MRIGNLLRGLDRQGLREAGVEMEQLFERVPGHVPSSIHSAFSFLIREI